MINDQLVREIQQICEAAGELILAFYSQRDAITVTHKADKTPVTVADKSASDLIQQGLTTLSPRLPVLSEEGDQPGHTVRKQWRRYWLVDPLDGTHEFLLGSGQFTVNIALIEDGRTVWGMIYAPVDDCFYWGGEGCVAQRLQNGVLSDLKLADADETALIATMSRGGAKRPQVIELLAAMQTVRPHQAQLILGSSLKFCAIAEGRANLYPRFGPTGEWDTAAGQAIVEAAGGVVCNFAGEPLRYNQAESLINSSFFVASSRLLKQQLLPMLAQVSPKAQQ